VVERLPSLGEGQGSSRVIIESVTPEVDGGRFAVKRVVGDSVAVEADVFADGHEELTCRLQYSRTGADEWRETAMQPVGNDRWRAEFAVEEIGDYCYRLQAWIDRFGTWQRDLGKRIEAGQDVALELRVGVEMVRDAASRAAGEHAAQLGDWAAALDGGDEAGAFDETLTALVDQYADRSTAAVYDRGQRIAVDRERAVFSAWYEMFPRSAAAERGRHGTFKDVIERLPYVAGMGFDVLYLPPIHPISRTNRKGKNNQPLSAADDPGSPWAIGAIEGGHKAIHPELGTLADFRELVAAAQRQGLEVALDIAFQCAPDHPYVQEHPQWFRHRPDGSIRYAENPPKRYEDIYPIDFETTDWQALWLELESVVRYWIEQGVRVFRVDNPHTKPFPFWEWLIGRIRGDYPEVIFLAEAFTRPRPMHYLAKAGFTQSYTYFTWRNTKQELTQYLTELTQTRARDYYRPNFWPNTPDILHEYLQTGGRPAFIARVVLAATLSGNYGIYGPAFELGLSEPREPHSEEYVDSEKYELKHWDIEAAGSLRDIITRLNRARRKNAALQRLEGLRFLDIDNEQLIAYAKTSRDGVNVVVVVANLDPHNKQAGRLMLSPVDFGIDGSQPVELEDELAGTRLIWEGESQLMELDPSSPARVYSFRGQLGTVMNG
jgi:starch synthase (maltosyl-transferring)